MNKVEFQEFLIAIEYKVRKMVSVIETNKLGEDATSKHHEFMIVIEEKVQDIFFLWEVQDIYNVNNGNQQIL